MNDIKILEKEIEDLKTIETRSGWLSDADRDVLKYKIELLFTLKFPSFSQKKRIRIDSGFSFKLTDYGKHLFIRKSQVLNLSFGKCISYLIRNTEVSLNHGLIFRKRNKAGRRAYYSSKTNIFCVYLNQKESLLLNKLCKHTKMSRGDLIEYLLRLSVDKIVV